MSHIVKVALKFKVQQALDHAIKTASCGAKPVENYEFYDGNKVSGLGIQFNGWRYKAVIDNEGTMVYDTFDGEWGDESHMEKFCREYTFEVARSWAMERGYLVQDCGTILNIITSEGGNIAVTADGQVATSGFAGSDCQETTGTLEALMGERQTESLTEEYYYAPQYDSV
jgi:hypothetical protein